MELSKRFSNGFSLDANYVWSKALDIQREDNQNPRTGADLALDYGPSTFDRRHVFKVSGVWELPFGPGKAFANGNNILNRYLLGGWQISGLLGRRSPTPFTVYAAPNADIGGFTVQFADNSCSNPYATSGQSPLQWLNNACFTQSHGTLGNQGKNSLRGPWITSLDLSAAKNIKTSEFLTFKLSADFLNALNHPQWTFNGQSQSVASPQSLGQASYLGSPRIIQLSLHAIF